MAALYEALHVNPAETDKIKAALQENTISPLPTTKQLNKHGVPNKSNHFYFKSESGLYLYVNTGLTHKTARRTIFCRFRLDVQSKSFTFLECPAVLTSWSKALLDAKECERITVYDDTEVEDVIEEICKIANATPCSTEKEEELTENCISLDQDTADAAEIAEEGIELTLAAEDTTDDELQTADAEVFDADEDETTIDEESTDSFTNREPVKEFIRAHNKEVQVQLDSLNYRCILDTLDMRIETVKDIIERNVVVEWHNYLTDHIDDVDAPCTLFFNTGIIKSDCRPLLVLCLLEEKVIRNIILSPGLTKLQKYNLTYSDAINRRQDCNKLLHQFGFVRDDIDYDDSFWLHHIGHARTGRLPAYLQNNMKLLSECVLKSIERALIAESMGISYVRPIRYDTEEDNNAVVIAIPLITNSYKSDTILVLRRSERNNFWKIITIERGFMAMVNLHAYNVYDMPSWFYFKF